MEAKSIKSNNMKKTSIILGTVLALSMAVFFVACSKEEDKTYSCECFVTWYETGESHTISMGTGSKECKSLSFSDIVSHVGGDATNASEYNWYCYEK